MANKQAEEGVALRLPVENSDRFKDGVPVAVPADASEQSGSKSTAKSATSKKES